MLGNLYQTLQVSLPLTIFTLLLGNKVYELKGKPLYIINACFFMLTSSIIFSSYYGHDEVGALAGLFCILLAALFAGVD